MKNVTDFRKTVETGVDPRPMWASSGLRAFYRKTILKPRFSSITGKSIPRSRK